MGLVESFAESYEHVRQRRAEAPEKVKALIDAADRLHPINLGLQALVYIEAVNRFHPSHKMIITAINEMRSRVLTYEEGRVEIIEAIRAFYDTLP